MKGGRSFLPGRTLTKVQALSAILIADSAAVALRLAPNVGLTALEAVGLVVLQPPWPQPADRSVFDTNPRRSTKTARRKTEPR